MRWFDIDPCYVFHIANAYDCGNSIVLQVVRYPEMWRNSSEFEADAALWRWTIDLNSGEIEESQVDDRGVEFPRVDDRLVGAAARYSVAVGSGSLVRYHLAPVPGDLLHGLALPAIWMPRARLRSVG